MEQVAQGLSFINGFRGYLKFLADSKVPVDVRRACIQSMSDLFKNLFAVEPLGQTCFMWFDWMRSAGSYDWHHVTEEGQILDAILETLNNILQIGSPECRRSALHGLSEFRYKRPERVTEIIDEFLREHQGIGEELRKYAIACRRGGLP